MLIQGLELFLSSFLLADSAFCPAVLFTWLFMHHTLHFLFVCFICSLNYQFIYLFIFLFYFIWSGVQSGLLVLKGWYTGLVLLCVWLHLCGGGFACFRMHWLTLPGYIVLAKLCLPRCVLVLRGSIHRISLMALLLGGMDTGPSPYMILKNVKPFFWTKFNG